MTKKQQTLPVAPPGAVKLDPAVWRRCPKCDGKLKAQGDRLVCQVCGRAWQQRGRA